VGKVGIFVTALIMPPAHDDIFWYNITHKIFKTIIPWPFRVFAKQDNGIALLIQTGSMNSRNLHRQYSKIPPAVIVFWTANPIWTSINGVR
jgi:hypothetical protein